jgi:hypothetical protein
MIFIKRHWPLIVAVGILWVVVGVCLIISIRQNQGYLVYALDDAYIHMAIAKNFALHGIWGITRYGFSSSSSSPLWTLLLSFNYLFFGVNEVTPFVLNVMFGTLLVFSVYRIQRVFISSPIRNLILLTSMIFFIPVPALTFTGLEHTLHTLLTIVFVYLSSRVLTRERIYSSQAIWLLILAPLITTVRYEGLFLVSVVCCLCFIKRKVVYGFSLGGLGFLPIAVYGLISVSNGWYFLPNSVLLKGNAPQISSLREIIGFIYYGYRQLIIHPHILMVVLGGLVTFNFHYSRQKTMTDSMMMIIIFIATTLLHMEFAKTGWFYRYEAYLVGLGVFILGKPVFEYFPAKFNSVNGKLIPRYVALTFIILFAVGPFVVRGTSSLIKIPRATTNIYEQQYQMGMFLRKSYQRQAIAANDIGAINYLSDIECLDLVGLGNLKVAGAKMGGVYNSQKICEFAKSERIQIAVIYDHWFEGKIPSEWIKVGHWKIRNNVVCASNVVSFYAANPAQKDILITNLEQFSQYLPKNVLLTKINRD